MPAWIAGIQVRKDATGDIHVNLDSSTPCWNDVLELFCLKLIEVPLPRVFKGEHQKCKVRFDDGRKIWPIQL